MTIVDKRPVTSFGSVRISDRLHTSRLRKAQIQETDDYNDDNRAEVLESIGDFEHKLGWRMRERTGPRWTELKDIEIAEERTMGIKPPRPPRPPSPTTFYDYNLIDPTGGGEDAWGEERTGMPEASTAADYERELRHLLSMTRPVTGFESARSVFVVTRNSHRADIDGRPSVSSPVGQRQEHGTVSRLGPELWTAQSMIEPIFIPATMAQRQAAASASSAAISHSQHILATGRQRRWEDGPGQQFYRVQEQQLRGAVRRSEAVRRRDEAKKGGALSAHRSEMVSRTRERHDQALVGAMRRAEPFPKAKVFADQALLNRVRDDFEQQESGRMRLGMGRADLVAESRAVTKDTAWFENNLQGISDARSTTRVRRPPPPGVMK